MGTLFKPKGSEVWYANFLDRNGKRQRESTHTRDKRVAKERLRDMELSTTDRGADEDKSESLVDALNYFITVACASKPEGTRTSYAQKARHLGRLMGEIRIGALRLEHVERYIASRLGEDKAHSHSVHKELVVLRSTLKARRGNVAAVPKFKSGYDPRRLFLTPDQFQRLAVHLVPEVPRLPEYTAATLSRQAITEHRRRAHRARDAKTVALCERARLRDPDAREAIARQINAHHESWRADSERRRHRRVLFCMLIAFASPRKGELLRLDWRDVDIANGTIRIPKGKTVPRPVPIADVLLPWLEHFGDVAGWRGPVVDPWHAVIRDLEQACKRAGVPRVTLNDLRRTFASWLVQAGESLFIVANLLGHSSTVMVEKVYGRLDDATRRRAINKLPSFGAAPRPALGAGSDAIPTRDASTTGASGTSGTSGTDCPVSGGTIAQAAIHLNERGGLDLFVPRVGVEPTRRGFSGLDANAPRVKPLGKSS